MTTVTPNSVSARRVQSDDSDIPGVWMPMVDAQMPKTRSVAGVLDNVLALLYIRVSSTVRRMKRAVWRLASGMLKT